MSRVEFHRRNDRGVGCLLCHRSCTLHSGESGACDLRECRDGASILSCSIEVAALHPVDIESAGFYHVLPGSRALQVEPGRADALEAFERKVSTGDTLARLARAAECRSLFVTGLEPAYVLEEVLDWLQAARGAGLATLIRTEGWTSDLAVEVAAPFVDAALVVVPTLRESTAERLHAPEPHRLRATLAAWRERGTWVEVKTEMRPSINDAEIELIEIAESLSRIDADIPWHLTHALESAADLDLERLPGRDLERAAEIADRAGLHFVYAPGAARSGRELTFCPRCDDVLLIDRFRGHPSPTRLRDGRCDICGSALAGLLEQRPLSARDGRLESSSEEEQSVS